MGQPSSAFAYTCPTQVRFGAGTHKAIIDALPNNARHVVVVCGRSGLAAAPVVAILVAAGIEITELSCAQEPSVPSINRALDALGGMQPDAVVSCGGGTAIDTGKVICFALANKLRAYADFTDLTSDQMNRTPAIAHIALPTTAGTGAEVTANAVIGIPEKAAKVSLRGRGLFPHVAIIDPDLMRSAPASVALHAGLDAVTQIFESHTSNARTRFSKALTDAARGIGLPALRRIVDAKDAGGWDDLAWVSHASGLALANSGLGAAHGLASVIGGRYGAPHGALCGRLLIPVLRQNLRSASEGSQVHARITECVANVSDVFAPLSKEDALSGFAAWLDDTGLPRLADWGVAEEHLSDVAQQGRAASSSQKNAVPLSEADYLNILKAAF